MHFKINTNGIRFKLFMLGSLPTLLLVPLLTYYFIGQQHQYHEQSLQKRGKTIVKQLAVASIYGVFAGNKQVLQELVDDLLKEKDVVYVAIHNDQNKTLAQAGNSDLFGNDNIRVFDAPVIIQSLQQNSGDTEFGVFEFGDPKREKQIGSIQLSLSLHQIKQSEAQFLRHSLAIIGGCFALVLYFALRLSRIISTPIINLTRVANELAYGNMNSRAGSANITEIATLCESFNAMAIGLEQTQTYLQQQIHKAIKELTMTMETLEQKNKSLEQTTRLAVAQNETKSQFLAHISHEIRTPMNGIIGFIDLLSQSELTAKQREQAQLIKTSANNLLTIVNEILDYSSLEMGNFKTDKITFNIRKCLENAIVSIFPRSTHVQLIIDIAPDVPTLLVSDPTRIRQVLTNLVGNACKYTRQGHIIIRCALTKKSRLFISVTDTGIGIADDMLKELFQPYLQISEYAVDNELGTGLGLTISKNICEKMGGRIGANSHLDLGSVFWFEIPVTIAEEPLKTRPNTLVTVIDPIPLRRKALLKQLEYLGYQARVFPTIERFLQQTEKREVILYGADTAFKSNTEFNDESSRIGPFIGETKIIFIVHQLLNPTIENAVSLPCRSTFLQDLIESTGATPQPITVQAPEKTSRHFSIFIADDNEINRLLLKSQLEKWSDDITLAEDGKQAWSMLQQHQYQLILLDLQMPFYNGLQLLEKLKQGDSLNRNTPVIAITAHAQSHQCKKLIDAGFDECLIKPIMLEQLDEVINVWRPLEMKASESNEASFYIEQMLEKTSNNKDLANVLFNKLFIELPGQVHAISQAMEQHDWEQARQITHKLHGSVGFCGFKHLKDIANELETQLSEQPTNTDTSFAELSDQIDRFIGLKQTILGRLISD